MTSTRKITVIYGVAKFIHTSMSYFKLTSTQYEGKNSLTGYISDIDNTELPIHLERMGGGPEFMAELVGKYNTVGIICNLFVEPRHRGHGLGCTLVESALNEFYTLNTDIVVLVPNLTEDNLHLYNGIEQWYKNRGFVTIARANLIPLMAINMKNYQVERL
jgi:GNAT superfamily N-acetyltransferase